VVVGVLSVAVLVCFAMYRTESGKKKLYEMLQKLPATKGAVLQLEVSRLIDGLSTFLSSGMDTDTAMEEAARVVTHPVLKGKVDQITQEMQEGKGLAQALYDHKILPPLYGRMLLSSARSGQLEPLLNKLADVTEMDAEQQIQRLISALEPTLTGCLTVSVGVTLLSIMLPLAGMLSAIG
jgi:type IV pilus assembly protein PilC